MEDNNGALQFKVGLDNSQLSMDAAKSKALIKGIGDTASKEGDRMQSAFNAASSQMGGIAALAGITSIGALGKAILDTTAKFEKFGIVLRNTLGDTRGNDALAMISDFAATTPFQLDEVTGAFIKMANQGFVPTRQQMILLGDVASSTGKSFDQLTEALLDAQTGQFERLKEFGIKASASGDKVTFSFKEQKTTVENTNSAIQAYILSLGTLKGVAGANEKISASLTGQLSNLGDKLAFMFNQIGTSNKGLLYDVVGGASALIDNYKAVGEGIGVLIGIFGVYKVATMAVAYEQKILAAANLIVTETNGDIALSEARLIVMKERSIASQKALNASMMANPWVLGAMAVAALGYALFKVITYQSDLEKAIAKTNTEILNERDKAAELFAALDHSTGSVEDLAKAKQAIIDQYGQYLTGQQTELNNATTIAEAYKAVNIGLEASIALKEKNSQLDAINKKYNEDLSKQTQNAVKDVKARDGAIAGSKLGFQINDAIGAMKGASTPEEIKAADAAFDELTKSASKGSMETAVSFALIKQKIQELRKEAGDVTEGFNLFAKAQEKAAAPAAKIENTTYDAQIKALTDKKAKLEKELAAIKATPGVDPMKAVVAKQGELDAVNKQLGVKDEKVKAEKLTDVEKLQKAIEKAAKAELDAIRKNKQEDADAARAKLGALTDQLTVLENQKKMVDSIIEQEQKTRTNDKMDSVGAQTKSDALAALYNEMGVDQYAKPKVKGLEASTYTKDALANIKEQAKIEQESNAKKADQLYQMADSFGAISNAIGDSNRGLADFLLGLGSATNEMGNLVKAGAFSAGGMSKADGASAAISGATQLIALQVNQAAENRKVMEDYYASVKKQQMDYNVLLNEQLLINNEIKGSVWIKDYEGKLNDSTKAYNDAQVKYAEEMKKFSESEAITGKKDVVSGKNVLTGVGAGAALGAGIGAILGGGVLSIPAAAAGAIIGGLIGGISGLFAKKKKDIVAPLLETYPELISKTGEFNAALAKSLIANDQVTEASKATLENIIKWKEESDKATEQLKGVISELTGGLGDDLRNALVKAFSDGTDAAEAFKGSVNKVLENIMSNMIFNAAFAGAFKQLQDAMAASYAAGGDQSWLDDFQSFYADSPELIKKFNDGMADAKSSATAAGFDIFNPTATTDTSATDRAATSKGIASMTQETGSELNGRFTSIQGHTFEIKESILLLSANSNQALKHLAGIEVNTGRLAAIEGDMAAVKQGIDTINLKGITIKI